MDGLPTAYPYTLMVPQGTTEQILHERLIALGGKVHREHEVTEVHADTRAVTVHVRGPAAERARVHELVWSSRFSVHHRLASGIAAVGCSWLTRLLTSTARRVGRV